MTGGLTIDRRESGSRPQGPGAVTVNFMFHPDIINRQEENDMKCIVIESKYLGYVRPFSQRGYKPYKVDPEVVKEKAVLEYNEYLKSVKAAEFAANPFQQEVV